MKILFMLKVMARAGIGKLQLGRSNILAIGLLLTLGFLGYGSSVQGYEVRGYIWPEATTAFHVSIPGADGLWNDTFEIAAQQWNDVTLFAFATVPNSFKDPCDNPNDVTARNGVKFSDTICGEAFDEITLAIQITWKIEGEQTPIQAGIWFNTAFQWAVYHGPTEQGPDGIFDFRRVAMHELGHALGLAHEEDVPSIMHAVVSDIELPTPDDIDGVNFLYQNPIPLLPEPSLLLPSDGATGITTAPVFSWSSVVGANYYWLTVATSADILPSLPSTFNCGGCVVSGATNLTSHTLPNAFPLGGTSATLSPNTTYYWRVQGLDSDGTLGHFSSIRSFTTGPSLLPAPTLSAPANGATGVVTSPTFSWSSVGGANRYWLMVATSAGAMPTDPTANTCPSCVISGSTSSTSHTLPNAFPYGGTSGSLSPGTTYYWKVAGWNTDGTSGNFSTVRSFTTAPNLLPAPTVQASEGYYDDRVVVVWSDVSGEDYYEVYRCTTDESDSCGTAIGSPAANTTVYDDYGAAADGTVYYYRLKACDLYGCSDFSSPATGHRFVVLSPKLYVALGDSYSSGEGAENYCIDLDGDGVPCERGEDTNDGDFNNYCHRSKHAYAWEPRLNHSVRTTGFFACSGATTQNIGRWGSGQYGEPDNIAQLNREPIDENTQLVTITIGGNDAGFKELLTTCYWKPNCQSYSDPDLGVLGDFYPQLIANDVRSNIELTLADVRLAAPSAQIYLLGYPRIFPPEGSDCAPLIDRLGDNGWAQDEQVWFNSLAVQLNTVLKEVASGADRVTFIDVTSYFANHEMCSQEQESWFREPGRNLLSPEIFHPTAVGQTDGYRAALEARLQVDKKAASQTLPESSETLGPKAHVVAEEVPTLPTIGSLMVTAASPVCASGIYPPGQALDLNGSEFLPGTHVTAYLISVGIEQSIGSAEVSAEGSFLISTTLPAEATESELALLTARGMGANGAPRVLTGSVAIGPDAGSDYDLDGVPDICDICVADFDPGQEDFDLDGQGNSCDVCPLDASNDADGDGLCANVDACPLDSNNDIDGDGRCAQIDNCPAVYNPDQLDSDDDLVGDLCDNCRGNFEASCIFTDGFESSSQ